MNPAPIVPTLRFARQFSDQDALEARSRGYLSHVLAQLGENLLYPLFFYDAVRLQHDLEENAKHGRPFLADPGLIVVPEITLDAMQHAVEQLSSEGFFDHLTPVTEDDLAWASPDQWPPQRRQTRSGKSVGSGDLPEALRDAADRPPLRVDEGGVIRVGNTRISLDLVVEQYENDMTPEDMARAYDTLVLADVHAVIAYYLRHRDEVRAYLKRRNEEAETLRARIEAERPRVGRGELLERRRAREKADAPTGQ